MADFDMKRLAQGPHIVSVKRYIIVPALVMFYFNHCKYE